MGNACHRLDRMRSACELAGCIERVEGLASNSTSPTDTWVLTMKPNTKYEDKPIEKVFAKIWFTRKTVECLADWHGKYKSLFRFPFNKKNLLSSISGLNYELDFYRLVVRPLVDFSICPHFIRYLGSGFKCRGKDLISMLGQREGAAQRFAKNYEYMYAPLERGRPSVTSTTPLPKPTDGEREFQDVSRKSRYTLLLNEHKGDDVTLKEFIKTPDKRMSHLLDVMFQVLAACYALSVSKSTHNDLHVKNIWVSTARSPKRFLLYDYDGELYGVKTQFFVRLYDFDRSYSRQIGENKYVCSFGNRYCHSNELIPNRDAAKIFNQVYNLVEFKDCRKLLLEVITPNPEFVESVFRHGFHLEHPKTDKSLSVEDLRSNFYPIETMLHKLGKLAGFCIDKSVFDKVAADPRVEYYYCNKNLFDSSGRLKSAEKVLLAQDAIVRNLREDKDSRITNLKERLSKCQQKIIEQSKENRTLGKYQAQSSVDEPLQKRVLR